jgi:16S rRNA (adenine1518-N6/adenine1519-N6)-dimethyltransferase
MKPKKSLGQNFLTSIPARNAIVAAGNLKSGEKVLEIGPGKGMLTVGLLEAGASVVALEKDRELIPLLKEKFVNEIGSGQLTLIEGDALTFVPTEAGLEGGKYKLIANIPYYITGAILSRYLESETPPSDMVVLVQKEVAERVVAREDKHSLLSLSVQVYGTPKIVYKVSKGSFNPVPKVDSAVLSISNISQTNFSSPLHQKRFFEVIHAGFAHKRKFLIRNLETISDPLVIQKAFDDLAIPKNARSEDISLSVWLLLSNSI